MGLAEELENRVRSGKTLHQARLELGLSRRKAQAIAKDRRLHGFIKAGAKPQWEPELLERAKILLEDGASYHEVSRTTGIPRTTLTDNLPGYGWTLSEAGKFGQMLLKTGGRVRES